jgi:hypothetical protein
MVNQGESAEIECRTSQSHYETRSLAGVAAHFPQAFSHFGGKWRQLPGQPDIS